MKKKICKTCFYEFNPGDAYDEDEGKPHCANENSDYYDQKVKLNSTCEYWEDENSR